MAARVRATSNKVGTDCSTRRCGFLEHGYGNLSMETIARDARVSLRTVYSQFGGKAGLFGALIRRCSDQFIGSLCPELPPEEALLSFAGQFCFASPAPTYCGCGRS